MTQVDELIIKIDELTNTVNSTKRSVEVLQKNVDLLFQDRQILEEVQASIISLRELHVQGRKHQDNLIKDVKAEIVDHSSETQLKVEDVQQAVEQKVDALAQTITKKRTVLVKQDSWLQKILMKIKGR